MITSLARRDFYQSILTGLAIISTSEITGAETPMLQLERITNGVARLSFIAQPGNFFRLEMTTNLSLPFQSVSGWFSGNGQTVGAPVYYEVSQSNVIGTSDEFTIYPFGNGQSLAVRTLTNGLTWAALVQQDYRTLPPLYIQPSNSFGGQLILQRGTLAWNPGYSVYNTNSLMPVEAAVLARLTTRYQEITNALAQGGPLGWPNYGPGFFMHEDKLFFRLRSMMSDEDSDGLDWATETFLTRTDPTDPDSDHDGVVDGIEDTDQDHIPDADEIAFGLNPLGDDASGLAQRFTYDALHRLRTIESPGKVVWTLTLDAQGNITRAGQ